jgi:hypothetical protein
MGRPCVHGCLIIEQYDFHGNIYQRLAEFNNRPKGRYRNERRLHFIAMKDDVYMYTGITSVGNDESNIGFIITTSAPRKRSITRLAGATEFSARNSAQGVVTGSRLFGHLPALLNISGQPTYFYGSQRQRLIGERCYAWSTSSSIRL